MYKIIIRFLEVYSYKEKVQYSIKTKMKRDIHNAEKEEKTEKKILKERKKIRDSER